MARYKVIDTSPRFLAVDLEKQLLPGSFEHAVHHLLEHEFDLSLFDTRLDSENFLPSDSEIDAVGLVTCGKFPIRRFSNACA